MQTTELEHARRIYEWTRGCNRESLQFQINFRNFCAQWLTPTTKIYNGVEYKVYLALILIRSKKFLRDYLDGKGVNVPWFLIFEFNFYPRKSITSNQLGLFTFAQQYEIDEVPEMDWSAIRNKDLFRYIHSFKCSYMDTPRMAPIRQMLMNWCALFEMVELNGMLDDYTHNGNGEKNFVCKTKAGEHSHISCPRLGFLKILYQECEMRATWGEEMLEVPILLIKTQLNFGENKQKLAEFLNTQIFNETLKVYFGK